MGAMPVQYDVGVVGAGLTGAAVARRLAEAGRRVLVLEAQDAVGGLSVHGCGLALLGTPEPYAALVERHGAEDARRIWALSQENLALLTAGAAQLGVPVRRVGTFRVTDDSGEAAVLERSCTALEHAGFAVELDDATESGYLVGLRTEDDLAFEPAALINGLLDHPDVVVRSGVEVETFNEVDNGVDVWVRKHYVRVRRLVLAPGPHLVHLDEALQGMITTAPLRTVHARVSERLAQPWILDAGGAMLCDQGEQWRIAAWSADPQVDPWATLARVGEQFCPEAPVLARHAGWIARTSDDRPLVGPLPGRSAVYVVGGLGAWGARWAFVAADRLVNVLEGEHITSLLALERGAR